MSITKVNVLATHSVKPTITSVEMRWRYNYFNFEILESEVKGTRSFAPPVHRPGLSRLAETSALHLPVLKNVSPNTH